MFERLTIKTDICIEPENEIVYHNPNDPEGMYNILDLAECLYSGGEAEAGILMEISRRLAAYEDSGLSPEEVQDLAKAKADGRLVVLPVKVGDTVYHRSGQHTIDDIQLFYPRQNGHVPEERIGKLQIRLGSLNYAGLQTFATYADEIGKTVFLTREEAEKAIGGKEDEK